MKKLLEKISSCENIKKCLYGDLQNPCYKIVTNQDKENFQLPEPWNGDLENAPVIILGSNPSINEEEMYPDLSWNIDEKFEFHSERFSGKWTKDQKYVMLKDGSYDTKSVRFWSSVRNRVKEIYPKKEITLGYDLCMIEIVKCKSRKEYGVKECMSECSQKYMNDILNFSNAKVILCLGKVAEVFIKDFYKLGDKKIVEDVEIAGKNRTVIFIPHPSSFVKAKKIENILNFEEIKRVQEKLAKNL